MTPERAKAIVRKKFPDYAVEWCVSYKGSFVVMAHPDDGPETAESGPYPDPFYAVNKFTGLVRRFVPVMEKDGGTAFFDTLERELGSVD